MTKEYELSYVRAMAEAMAAEQAHGHNDHPLYEDYGADERAMLDQRSRILLKILDEMGYRLIRERVVRS